METSKCQVCGSPVEKGTKAAVCPACETPAHPECWEYNGGCTTYACKESPAIKNSKPRAPAPVYIDGRSRQQERRAPPRELSSPGAVLQSVFDFAMRTLGWIIGTFMFFAFMAGFIEGLTKGGSRSRPRRHQAPLSRAQKIHFASRAEQLVELHTMARSRKATLEDIKAAGSAATWNTDHEIRMAATEALVNVDGHESARQEILCNIIGIPDAAQRKLVVANIPDLGRPTQEGLNQLVRGLSNDRPMDEDAMVTLERLRPDKEMLARANRSHRVPGQFKARFDKLLY